MRSPVVYRTIIGPDLHVLHSSDSRRDELHAAGLHENRRFWRITLDSDEEDGPQIQVVDICLLLLRHSAIGVLTHCTWTGGSRAQCCTAALLLKSLVEGVQPVDRVEEPAIWWAPFSLSLAGQSGRTRGDSSFRGAESAKTSPLGFFRSCEHYRCQDPCASSLVPLDASLDQALSHDNATGRRACGWWTVDGGQWTVDGGRCVDVHG